MVYRPSVVVVCSAIWAVCTPLAAYAPPVDDELITTDVDLLELRKNYVMSAVAEEAPMFRIKGGFEVFEPKQVEQKIERKEAFVQSAPGQLILPASLFQKQASLAPQKETPNKSEAKNNVPRITKWDVGGFMVNHLVGQVPAPYAMLPGYAHGAAFSTSASVVYWSLVTSITEDREMGHGEACVFVMNGIFNPTPFPLWDKWCEEKWAKINLCEGDWANYPGLRDDDPVGRPERMRRYKKKYCKAPTAVEVAQRRTQRRLVYQVGHKSLNWTVPIQKPKPWTPENLKPVFFVTMI